MTKRERRTFERAVALQVAQELVRTLGPIEPEMLAEKADIVCEVFGRVLDKNEVADEAEAAGILSHCPEMLADLNREFAEVNRRLDAATRPAAILTGRPQPAAKIR